MNHNRCGLCDDWIDLPDGHYICSNCSNRLDAEAKAEAEVLEIKAKAKAKRKAFVSNLISYFTFKRLTFILILIVIWSFIQVLTPKYLIMKESANEQTED